MENNNLDLWPESFAVEIKINPPLAILREQASLLERKTGGLVKAAVQKSENAIVEAGIIAMTMLRKPTNSVISYSFWLLAPAFGNYRYQLFTVEQPIEMYPLRIVDSPLEDMEITSEDDLLAKLKLIFASDKAQRVIGAMIAQSQTA